MERFHLADRYVQRLAGGQHTLPYVDQVIIEAEIRDVFEVLEEPVVAGAIGGLVEGRSGRLLQRHWSNPEVLEAVLERRRERLEP